MKRRNPFGLLAVVTAITLLPLVTGASARAAEPGPRDWPRWRGPEGTGHTSDKDLPLKWDASSILWKTPLKGRGQSSPVISGDRIFLTSALDEGRQRIVFCLDRHDGKTLWEQVAWRGDPEPTHELNGWATATCCTDGERVYASFGRGGLHCYTVEGKHLWSRDLGRFLSRSKRGTAASPVLAGDLVILNGDSESDPYLFGINKLTGETVWRTDRPKAEGYSTPLLLDVNGGKELVLNGDPFIAGYDPATGKQLWWCKSFAPRGEPTPAYGNGVLFVINGQAGDVYAVRPGGKGDVTHTQMLWHTPRRNGRDSPSPIVVGDYVLVSNMAGVGTAYDAATGRQLWQQRLGTGNITASPLAAGGASGDRVYFVFESGVTVILAPGPEPKVLATNDIGAGGEIFRASPTPSDGRLLLRSDRALYCIGSRQ